MSLKLINKFLNILKYIWRWSMIDSPKKKSIMSSSRGRVYGGRSGACGGSRAGYAGRAIGKSITVIDTRKTHSLSTCSAHCSCSARAPQKCNAKNGFYLLVCLCVCVWVCWSIISKSSWPILMKLGRMVYNDKIQVPFEDEMNRCGRTHTSPIKNVKIAIVYKVLGQTP